MHAGRYGTARHRPLETLESGEGSQSEHNTQLSVEGEGEGEGSGLVGEWERGEDSQRPRSADSLMKVRWGEWRGRFVKTKH